MKTTQTIQSTDTTREVSRGNPNGPESAVLKATREAEMDRGMPRQGGDQLREVNKASSFWTDIAFGALQWGAIGVTIASGAFVVAALAVGSSVVLPAIACAVGVAVSSYCIFRSALKEAKENIAKQEAMETKDGAALLKKMQEQEAAASRGFIKEDPNQRPRATSKQSPIGEAGPIGRDCIGAAGVGINDPSS